MEATVTVTGGNPLDIQRFVRKVEESPLGRPAGSGKWQWKSLREDIVDRVIAFSMEYPDLECEVEGISVHDGISRETLWLWVCGGSGTYERTDFERLNKRLPADLVYDTVKYRHRLQKGRVSLTEATIYATEDKWSLDVTHYLK